MILYTVVDMDGVVRSHNAASNPHSILRSVPEDLFAVVGRHVTIEQPLTEWDVRLPGQLDKSMLKE